MYNILQALIKYKNNNMDIERITVLVEMSKNDVRAIYATDKPVGGYTHFSTGAIVTNELMQNVAAYGYETMDRDKIFPNWKANYTPSK